MHRLGTDISSDSILSLTPGGLTEAASRLVRSACVRSDTICEPHRHSPTVLPGQLLICHLKQGQFGILLKKSISPCGYLANAGD